jgi:deoxyribonuclease-4
MVQKPKKRPPLLGAHFSIAKGLHRALLEAVSYGCNTLQIFTKNASAWKERTVTDEEATLFKQTMAQTGIQKIASHTSYLINLAAVDEKKHSMACNALKNELIRSHQLSIPYVVLHLGAHMGSGIAGGIEQVAGSINKIFEETPGLPTRLLLETTAGQGTSIGHTFEQLAETMEKIEQKDRIGVCLDTCHIFAAGYDIRAKAVYRKTIKAFDTIVGLAHLYVIHLNDSKKDFGSKVDRHANIGKGQIGLSAFRFIMNDKRFHDIPKIIETEKGKRGEDWDKINLTLLRSLISI